MAVRLAMSPHLFRLMSAEDQKVYSQLYGQTIIETTVAVPKLNRYPSPQNNCGPAATTAARIRASNVVVEFALTSSAGLGINGAHQTV